MFPDHTIPTSASKDISPELLDIFVGPLLQYLMPVTDAADECCLIKTVVPSGVTVPIHSHADREIFYILCGELQGMTGGSGAATAPAMCSTWREASGTRFVTHLARA